MEVLLLALAWSLSQKKKTACAFQPLDKWSKTRKFLFLSSTQQGPFVNLEKFGRTVGQG